MLELIVNLIDGLTGGSRTARSPATKGIFDVSWVVLAMMVNTDAAAVVKKFHEAMTVESIRSRICTFDTLGMSFTTAIVFILRWLHQSSIGNWDDLAVKLTKSYLKLNRSIPQKTESPHTLSQSSYINNANLTTRILSRFADLLNPRDQGGIMEVMGLSSAAGRRATLRVAVLKAAKEVGEEEDSVPCDVYSMLNPVLAGVLGSICIVSHKFDVHAQQILIQQVCKRYYMLLNSDTGRQLTTTTINTYHTASCLWLGLKTAEAVLKYMSEDEINTLKASIRDFFINTLLADNQLFTVKGDEVTVNKEFVGSNMIINHPTIFVGNRKSLADHIRLLDLQNDEILINMLHAHSGRMSTLLSNSFQSRSSKGIIDLARSSFVDVIGYITLGTPLNERQPMNLATARKFMSTLEAYFPAFGHTSLPPLPPPPPQGSPNAAQNYQLRYRQALVRRQQFHSMQKATKVLVGVLEYQWSPHYSKELLSGITQAEEQMLSVGGGYATMILCFRLFCLKLAAKFVDTGDLSYHIPDFMRFVRVKDGKLYPRAVVSAAHDLIVKVIKIPNLMSALSFCKYIQECIPVRPLSDGRMAVNTGLLPHRLLLEEFTRNIRAVCQKVEKWDFSFGEAAKSSNNGVLQSVRSSDHPSGVGLVLYVVESLRITCLSLHKRRGFDNYRKLYVHALVNLLQCLHTAVLTHACLSLESVFSSLTDIQELTFWLSYTSKAIKESHNPSTKQQVVAWFLTLQSRLSPEKMGIRAKL
eukprot:TRINITY_DN4134_c0_g1_i2.p1 TRINITY_DN4134_c0_g1~~TRINITY_DN4134_c0_g1_i2.p1  ORF type:complete len:754 (+),score=99.90 TRINITY_DN4134_c0_g1_i2:504-2765(+)